MAWPQGVTACAAARWTPRDRDASLAPSPEAHPCDALLSRTFTTLAVAAKHPMTSASRFVLIETAFTVVQFLLVGALLALSGRVASSATRGAALRSA